MKMIRTLAVLLIAASTASANGLERLSLQMRSLPGLQAAPMAGMKRLAVSTGKNATRMKQAEVRKIEKGLAITQTGAENQEAGEKISKHLLKYGEESFDLFDQPARCVTRTRGEGESGIEMLACQQFAMIEPEGEMAHQAVLRHAVGDITVYHETWTKDAHDTFKIEQYSFLVGPSGELQEAVKTIFAAGEDEMPVMVVPAEEFSAGDPVIGAVYREIATDVLKTLPQIQI
jgi:hypothetical protein